MGNKNIPNFNLCLLRMQGYLPFTWENQKFRLKIKWFVSFGLRRCNFYSFYQSVHQLIQTKFLAGHSPMTSNFIVLVFIHKISTRVVCANGKQPRFKLPAGRTKGLKPCVSNFQQVDRCAKRKQREKELLLRFVVVVVCRFFSQCISLISLLLSLED